jgi:hypothetical protein
MKPFTITGTQRSPNSYTVHLRDIALHFSYSTLVGVHVFAPGIADPVKAYRQRNTWGSTTHRHMQDAGLTYKTVKVVTENELYEVVRGALFDAVIAAPLNHSDMEAV